MAAQNVQKSDIVITRVFDAPIERVWDAWRVPEYIMQWWGPTGFTSPVAQMDFREGGTSLVCMRAPQEFGGQDFYNTWTYHKIVPLERIELIAHFADEHGSRIDPASLGLLPDLPQEVRQVVTFKALDTQRTEMTITEYGYTSEQAYELSKMGMEQCLDKMAASFARA